MLPKLWYAYKKALQGFEAGFSGRAIVAGNISGKAIGIFREECVGLRQQVLYRW